MTTYPKWIEEHCEDLGNGYTYYNDGQSDPCLLDTEYIKRVQAESWEEFWNKADYGFICTDSDVATAMRDACRLNKERNL